MLIFVAWLALSIGVGFFANIEQKRSGVLWFIGACLISPLLAFIILVVLGPATKTIMLAGDKRSTIQPGDTVNIGSSTGSDRDATVQAVNYDHTREQTEVEVRP